MLDPDLFVRELDRAGFGLVSGVPCSYLTPLINAAIDATHAVYVGAANEGEAVAIACGAELGGVRGAVMFQNSGFGNAVNPLTSLAATLEIPVLVITTWRGCPEQTPDEPQHELMGRITRELMDLIEIPWESFPKQDDDVAPMLARAIEHMNRHRRPYGLIMEKGSVAPRELRTLPDFERCFQLGALPEAQEPEIRLEQDDVLRTIQSNVGATDVILATTGFTGRALYALADRPNQLYVVGSMGCASSLGLGLAKVQPLRRVVVIDGDGALLMRMGALATIAAESPPNLVHILLDNAVHDSTGSQATVSPGVDFAALALAAGYPRALRVDGLDDLGGILEDDQRSLVLLHLRTRPRSERKLPRPHIKPPQVAQRLREWLRSTETS